MFGHVRSTGLTDMLMGVMEAVPLPSSRRERITRDPEDVLQELLKAFQSKLPLQELVERAEWLAVVFSKQPVMVMVVKSEGEIVYANRFSFEHMKYQQEELIGSRYQDFVLPAYKKSTKRAHGQMQSGVLLGTFSNAWKTGDGGFRNLLWVCSSWIAGTALALAVPVDLCDLPTCEFRAGGVG